MSCRKQQVQYSPGAGVNRMWPNAVAGLWNMKKKKTDTSANILRNSKKIESENSDSIFIKRFEKLSLFRSLDCYIQFNLCTVTV